MTKIIITLLFVVSLCGLNAIHDTNDKLDNVRTKEYLYMRDYQIECTTDSMFIMDANRIVGVIPYDSSMVSGIILQDNE